MLGSSDLIAPLTQRTAVLESALPALLSTVVDCQQKGCFLPQLDNVVYKFVEAAVVVHLSRMLGAFVTKLVAELCAALQLVDAPFSKDPAKVTSDSSAATTRPSVEPRLTVADLEAARAQLVPSQSPAHAQVQSAIFADIQSFLAQHSNKALVDGLVAARAAIQKVPPRLHARLDVHDKALSELPKMPAAAHVVVPHGGPDEPRKGLQQAAQRILLPRQLFTPWAPRVCLSCLRRRLCHPGPRLPLSFLRQFYCAASITWSSTASAAGSSVSLSTLVALLYSSTPGRSWPLRWPPTSCAVHTAFAARTSTAL